MAKRLSLLSLLAVTSMGAATLQIARPASAVELDPLNILAPAQVQIGENCWDRNSRPLDDELYNFNLDAFDPWSVLRRKKPRPIAILPPDIVCHPIYAVDQTALAASLSGYFYPDGTPIEPKNEPKRDPWAEYGRPDPPEGYDWQPHNLWGLHLVSNGRAPPVVGIKPDPFNYIGMIDPDPFHDLVLADDGSFKIVSNGRAPNPKHARDLWEGNSTTGAIDPDQNHRVQLVAPGLAKIIDLQTGTDTQDWQREEEAAGSRFDGSSNAMKRREDYLLAKVAVTKTVATTTKFASEHPEYVQAAVTIVIVSGLTYAAGAALIGRAATILLNTSEFAFAGQFAINRVSVPPILYFLYPIGRVPGWTKDSSDWAARQAKEAESELIEHQAKQAEQAKRDEQAARTAENEKAQRDVDTPYEPNLHDDTRLDRRGPGSYMLPAEHTEFKNV